jgi:predicted PurR-regulated permease PerM
MARTSTRPATNRAIGVLTATTVVFFLAFALYWARAIFIPLALAVFFTFILTPLVIFLHHRGLGRVPSVMVVMAGALLIFGVVGLIVGHQVVHLTNTLPDHAGRIKEKVSTIKGWVSANEGSRLGELGNDVYNIFAETPPVSGQPGAVPTVMVEPSQSWFTRAQGVAAPIVGILGQAAFTFVLVLYMLLRREDLRNRMLRLLGHGRVTTTTKAVDETSRRISRYLLSQFLLNASFGVVITVGLLLMRVQYAPVWGFFAFLMRYVPYIGTWIGVLPPALFTFAVSDGWGMTVMVLVLYVGLELLCNNIFEPLLYGKSLGLSEVAQLVATAFWALLWGPVGLILAWPLTTCLLMLGKYVPQWKFLNVLLGDEPVLSPRVAFYQRLAAQDQDEAAEIVEKELSTRSTEEVFDDLLMPALSEARRESRGVHVSDADVADITRSVLEIAEEVAEFKRDSTAVAEDVTGDRPRVLLVPAKDAVDQAAIELFARLLDPTLWEVQVSSVTILTSELVAQIEEKPPSILIIGSLPPGGLTHTRFLCKRIQQKFPDLKVLVGRWTGAEEEDRHWQQLRAAGADEIAATVEAAKTYLNGWRAVFTSAPSPLQHEERPAERKRALVSANGTVPA